MTPLLGRSPRGGAVAPLVAGCVLVSAAAPAAAFDHSAYDKLLRRYVKGGRVAYARIKREARDDLARYLAAVGKARLKGVGRDARLAFYLNAYNALVIKAVVDRYPIARVTAVRGFFDRLRYRVAGRRVTLDQLEKKIILPTFKDPRVHFALVCAARSCPPLRARAYRGRTVRRVLELLARRFINSRRGVRVAKAGRVAVSRIFQWYAKDFSRASGSVGRYLAKYHARHAAALRRRTTFAYLPYSWALNKR